MALIRRTMVWTTALLAMLAIASATNSVTAGEAPPQRFVAIALHDVVDTPSELGDDSVTSDRLVVLFEWLAGNGWTARSLDDIDRALLRLLTEGHTNAEMAEKVDLTEEAVGVRLAKLLARLGVSNRAEATTLAFKGFAR